MKEEETGTDHAIPVRYIVLGITTCSAIIVFILGYVTWRFCRKRAETYGKDRRYSSDQSPDSTLMKNLKISQSTPELAAECAALDSYSAKAKGILKSLRQSTLPTVPQRHQTFQRQLPVSHKLDITNIEFSVQSVKHKEQPQLGAIKPELYKQASIDSIKSEHAICGKLSFSMQYLPATETLLVCIIKAEDLPAKDFSGTSDPYVKVYLLPDRKHKYQTKVHRKTLNPDFNETFAFNVPFKELENRLLQLNVYDFDRFSRHDLIGTVVVRDIVPNENRLQAKNFFVKDILSTNQEKFDLGELMMSLCYLPTAGRLTLTIVKARNLKAMDITGASDPYVKVALMCEGNRIKKRKTTVKKNTLNPVYNEAMVFDVPQENVEDVYLFIKVIDYDRIGSNETMGCCGVGPKYVGIGRDHWFEMLENPRKPVAQWYNLLEHVYFHDDTTHKRSCFRYRQSTTDSTCSEASVGH